MLTTQALLEYLRQDGVNLDDRQSYDHIMDSRFADEAHGVPGISVEINERRKRAMLKQLLRDAGYHDIAKMTKPVITEYDPREI